MMGLELIGLVIKNNMKSSTKKIADFAKWLEKEGEKNWGKKCKDYELDCILCRFWRVFADVKGLVDEYKSLDK